MREPAKFDADGLPVTVPLMQVSCHHMSVLQPTCQLRERELMQVACQLYEIEIED